MTPRMQEHSLPTFGYPQLSAWTPFKKVVFMFRME